MRKAALSLLVALAFGCSEKKPAPVEVDAGPAGPPELPEKEPNDRASSAMPLTGPVLVQSALSPDEKRSDEDFYRLAAAPGQSATVSVSAIPGVDLALELLDVDGNRIASFNSQPEGQGEKIPALSLARDYVVRVFSPKKGSGGAYTLSVDVQPQPEGFELEPNERPIDATPLPPGEPIQGTIADRADEDWYVFDLATADGSAEADAGFVEDAGEPSFDAGVEPVVDAGVEAAPASDETVDGTEGDAADAGAIAEAADAGAAPVEVKPSLPPLPEPPAIVRIDLEGVPGVRLQVELANQAEAVFYSARSRAPGEGISVRNVALRPNETRYFVIVKSAWMGSGKDVTREFNQTEPYKLTVTQEEVQGTAELEPNDEAGKATPLVGDGVRHGYFAPKGDVDYFLIRYEQPSLVKVELSGVDRVDSVLSVVRPAEGGKTEEALLRANDGGAREGELLTNLAVGPEGLLLKVEAASRQVDGKWVRDQENPSQPYQLNFTSRVDEGAIEREPNDVADRATPVELGTPLRGHIHPRKDLDLYRVDLSGSPVKVPLKATVTGILKVDIAAALYRLGEDGKLAVLQTAEREKGDGTEVLRHTVEPGVYYLGVRDTRNRESNFVDSYQVLVERDE